MLNVRSPPPWRWGRIGVPALTAAEGDAVGISVLQKEVEDGVGDQPEHQIIDSEPRRPP